MKILYLAHRIPYPPNKGDKIRSFNEIKYLSRRHEIHLACLADNPKDLKYECDLKKYCKTTNVIFINPKLAKLKSTICLFSTKPLSICYFYSKRLQKAIDHLLSTHHFDCIFCFSSPMAEYIFRSKFLVSGFQKLGFNKNINRPETSNQQPATKIMDFVDVDSDKWAQYAQYVRFPQSWIYRLESRKLARYEKKVAETFDHSIFVTGSEVKIFKDQNPHIKNITAIPNGVDLDYFSPRFCQKPETSLQQPVIVFTGAMDYFANIDGVVWFTKEILPLIKKEIPEIRFYIVGSNPTKEVLSLSDNNNVTVTGYVPDTREYLGKATVVVVPLRIARGIQNKILEAMATGVPVVATPKAFEGIEAEPDRDLVLGEDPKKFADLVIKLIKEVSLRESIGNNARRVIENNYSWTKNLEKLDRILAK
jgi:sugar transferase (PEP-CTERM/EpsH1 system associated)